MIPNLFWVNFFFALLCGRLSNEVPELLQYRGSLFCGVYSMKELFSNFIPPYTHLRWKDMEHQEHHLIPMDKVEHMGTANWMETRARREQQISCLLTPGRQAKKVCTHIREA